jgi:NADH-quinone oxidoreductase subunit L
MNFLNFFLFFLFVTPLGLSTTQYLWGRKEDANNLSYINLAGTFMAALIFSGMLIGTSLSSSWHLSLFSVSALEFHWGGEINETSSAFLLVCIWLNVFAKFLAERDMIIEDTSQGRLFLYLDLFLLAVFITISANYFIPLFLGWELLGVVSYLLLSFTYESPVSNQAAFTAFLYDKISSVFLLLGGGLLIFSYGDISFSEAQWDSIKHSFVGIFFFIAIYCKLFQFGVNTWVARLTDIPSLSLSMITNFLYGLPAFVLLWRLQLLQVSLLKIIALYLGAATFIFAISMALLEPLLKKVVAYLTIAYWGMVLIFSTLGFYKFSFIYMLALSVTQFILFGVEKILSSQYKEPLHLLKGLLKNSSERLCASLIIIWAIAHTILLGAAGALILDSSFLLLWILGGGFFLLSLAIWRPVFLLGIFLFGKRAETQEEPQSQWWNRSFFVIGVISISVSLFYFWHLMKESLEGKEIEQWIKSIAFLGSGVILSCGGVFLFPNRYISIERNRGWEQMFLKQAYLETLYDLGFVKSFKWVSTSISQKIDGFLIEEQAFTGSISALKRGYRLMFWFQKHSFSFYLLLLLLGCLSLLFFFIWK